MPCYQATIIRAEAAIPPWMFKFVAGSDMDAVARMPVIKDDCAVELWRGNRLIALIEGETVSLATCNLNSLAAEMIRRIMADR